ncbi:hypothetical protein H0H93_006048 [Arthromyces matolae]|nr:hypothetical protein H0H93_006048 [Arthromyces matolae]
MLHLRLNCSLTYSSPDNIQPSLLRAALSIMSPKSGDQDAESSKQIRKPLDADNDLLVLQIRAFLEAAEDVDIDVETVEDLMQSLPADFDSDVDPVEENGGVPVSDDLAEVSTWNENEISEDADSVSETEAKGMSSWINEYVVTRQIPIPNLLKALGVDLCQALQTKKQTTLLYFLKVALSRELRNRDKLTQYNTISDATELLRSSRRILILTGAGISVSCGIPDFRSRDGLYASLKHRGKYDLDDPQQMFDINFFRENPAVF